MVMATIPNVLEGNQVYPCLVELSYAIPSASNLFVTLFVNLCEEKKERERSRGMLLANIRPLKAQRNHLRLVL